MKSFRCHLNNVQKDTKLYKILLKVFASKKFEDHYFGKPTLSSVCRMD